MDSSSQSHSVSEQSRDCRTTSPPAVGLVPWDASGAPTHVFRISSSRNVENCGKRILSGDCFWFLSNSHRQPQSWAKLNLLPETRCQTAAPGKYFCTFKTHLWWKSRTLSGLKISAGRKHLGSLSHWLSRCEMRKKKSVFSSRHVKPLICLCHPHWLCVCVYVCVCERSSKALFVFPYCAAAVFNTLIDISCKKTATSSLVIHISRSTCTWHGFIYSFPVIKRQRKKVEIVL